MAKRTLHGGGYTRSLVSCNLLKPRGFFQVCLFSDLCLFIPAEHVFVWKIFCDSNKIYSFAQKALYFKPVSTIYEVHCGNCTNRNVKIPAFKDRLFSLTGEVIGSISFPCKTCMLPIKEFGTSFQQIAKIGQFLHPCTQSYL